MASDADGHVLGNFHSYYSFNPVHERLRFLNKDTINALRRALLVHKSFEEKSRATSTVLDVGCNEGDLTIGLFECLSGRAAPNEISQVDGMTNFDLTNISILNERMQKDKKLVEYLIQDKGDISHCRRYMCELQIEGQFMSLGEGVSKKVAKARAAKIALQTLDGLNGTNQKQQKEPSGDVKKEELLLTENELATRMPLIMLGVDIDKKLIERAAKKPVQVIGNDVMQFCHVDVMTNMFETKVASFIELAPRSTLERKFDLVTCFSVTMWIHLNHGDDGLWKFLESISSMTEHLIIEPQTWKCYRNAQKRLNRLRVEIPESFHKIQVRMDVVEKIDAFLLAVGRFRHKAFLGKTNWSRNVVLYSRTLVPGIAYTL
ncbi:hypothetical protein CCR75_005913 [Bremia lactucae]|uniref:RNA methyltransferase n=1 Tax=Bremia lactucae TaxID=4779 RepID=A0A976FDR4_BRELC|nr:hypothetical protein CCR75_005913 [Bremia lactucae]